MTRTTDDIASYIRANFKTDKEKARAIFIWTASNIEYDIANMFAINFYEKPEEKIARPLRTRKGICENYAALFNGICNKAGIKSYIIEGYTKQNGFTDYIPHAWCAALVDSSWFLFDPTWGSGYLNGGKFYKKINNDYFKASPAVLIKSHMPFDYLWQFLHYPVSSQEFYEGKTQINTSKAFFNYTDSIAAYEKQTRADQLTASAERIEKNGVRNSMLFDRLQHIKAELENIKIDHENARQAAIVNQYNSAVNDYNTGIEYLNDFINYRNKQFIPVKSDADIQNMVDLADGKLTSAKTKLNELTNADANITTAAGQLAKLAEEAANHVKEQQDWLKIYVTKSKAGRKSMFYEKRITWFGIPLTK